MVTSKGKVILLSLLLLLRIRRDEFKGKNVWKEMG